jgi:hypothetical protein
LTTDGSGLGVGVPGSDRSGFAAAKHRNSSSGGLAGRPDSGRLAQRCDGVELPQCGFPVLLASGFSFPPPILSSSPCFSFLFLPEKRHREGHGACGMRLTPAGCQGLGSVAAALISPTSSSLLAVDRDYSPMGRRRGTGRRMGGFL